MHAYSLICVHVLLYDLCARVCIASSMCILAVLNLFNLLQNSVSSLKYVILVG